MIFNFEGDPPDFEGLPDDFEPPSMGNAQAIRNAISDAIPGVDWSDPAWGMIDGDGWSIEFNHQDTGETDQIMLHVRGSGDPVTAIVKLCKTNNWSAFDTTSGEFINLDAPSTDGWTGFQAFRDRAVTQTVQEPEPKASYRLYLFIGLGIILLIVIVLIMLRNR